MADVVYFDSGINLPFCPPTVNGIYISGSGCCSEFYSAFIGGNQTYNLTYTLPTSSGTSGQVLTNDGNGNLSWTTVSGGGGGGTGTVTGTGTTNYLSKWSSASGLTNSIVLETGSTIDISGALRVTTSSGTATSVMGRDANGYVSNLLLGNGLSISGGTLSFTGSTGVSGNFVPYLGATGNTDLGGYGIAGSYFQLSTSTGGTLVPGMFSWNGTDGTADLMLKGGNVTLQLGQEQVARVINETGANLLESQYKVVRVNGSTGTRLKVALALASGDATSVETLGVVTENITLNQEGFVTTSGLVRGINTTGSLQGETWSDGDMLFLSPYVAGGLTNIKPQAPNHLVVMGYVVTAANNGSIYVKVDNGYELDELHNVLISSAITNNILAYDGVTGVWRNRTASSLNLVSGSGTATQVAFWGGSSGSTSTTLVSSTGLTWDATNQRLGIGVTSTPPSRLTVQGTTATDGGQLGAELLSAAGWTSAGWTGDYTTGFTHSTGNTTALTNTLAAVNGTYYQIGYTVSGRTAGTFTVTFGGITSSSLSATGSFGPRATSTGTFSITPTSDFNGTIVLSIKTITAGSATISLFNSSGTVTNEIRGFLDQSNVAIGYLALSRNTTGIGNVVFGQETLRHNTTGTYNVVFGGLSLQNNTTGSNNSVFGYNSMQNNISGNNNTSFGYSALFNSNSNSNSAFGFNSLFSNTSGLNNAAFGVNSLANNTTGSNNSAFGLGAGNNSTTALTGSNNTLFGYQTATNIQGTASGNLVLGNSVNLPIASGSNQVVIKNIIFATGASGTGTNIAGSVGIGTASPSQTLHVAGTMRLTDSTGTGTTLMGRDANGDVSAISVGSGLSLSGNTLTTTGTTGVSGSGTATQVAFWDGATGTTSNTLTSSTGLTWDNTNRRLGVGINSPTSRLHVVGVGTGSTTTSFLIENNDTVPARLFSVRDDGRVYIGTQSNTQAPYFAGYTGNSEFGASQRTLGIRTQFTSGLRADPGILFGNSVNFDFTSNSSSYFIVRANFAPTSGNGVLNTLILDNTINQTGGASGTTRGLHVNPTLTSAFDWRSIEWSNNSGYGLYGAGTANNYLGGNTSIGVVSPSARLHVVGSGIASSTYTAQFHNSGGNNNALMIRDDGNVGVGTSSPEARLQVQGFGTIFQANENVNLKSVFRVIDNGFVRFGNGANSPVFFPQTNQGAVANIDGTNLAFYNYTTSQSTAFGRYFFAGETGIQTTGSNSTFYINDNFSPTSGTALNTNLVLRSTINQTGGASGTTRGLYVNPILTSAFDWRSIEWSNNSGYGLYGAGTANNYLGGNTSIGVVSPSARLHVVGSGNTSASTAFLVQNSSSNNMISVLNNGNVGINNASPIAKLYVKGETSGSGSTALEVTDNTDRDIINVRDDGRITLGRNLASNVQSSVTIEAVGTETNIGIAIVPKGTGAFTLGIPDGGATGGNARGSNAIDLQTSRSVATQVAGGTGSVVMGQNNTGSGNNAVAIGINNNSSSASSIAIGSGNGSSATSSVSIGAGNAATANYSTAFGRSSRSTLYGQLSKASGNFASLGDCQTSQLNSFQSITGTTAAELTLDGGSPAASNRLILNLIGATNGRLWNAIVQLSAICTTAGGTVTVGESFIGTYNVGIKRIANATSLIGTVQNMITVQADTNMLSSVVTITADDTNESLKIEFTPPTGANASTVIRVVATVYLTEVGY